MNKLDLYWNKELNQVVAVNEGADAPEGFTLIGQHEDKPGRVLINTVREILYHHGHENMQSLKVTTAEDVVLNPRPADNADLALTSQQPTSNVAQPGSADTSTDTTAVNSQQNVDKSSTSIQDDSNPDPVAVVEDADSNKPAPAADSGKEEENTDEKVKK